MTTLGWSIAAVLVATVVIVLAEIAFRRAWRKRMERLKQKARR